MEYLQMKMIFCSVFIIVNLTSVSYVLNVEAATCTRFTKRHNLTMDTSICVFENSTEPIPATLCIDLCFKNNMCNGVSTTFDTLTTTRWCCLIVESTLTYRQPGDLILYHAPDTPVQCQRGWDGPNCDACSPRFGPPGECSRCGTGWTGDNCDECEGFGFNKNSACTECIQNGHWTGLVNNRYTINVYLTFTGPRCSEIIPGTSMWYTTSQYTIVSGDLDDNINVLEFANNGGFVFSGEINLNEKSVSGTAGHLNPSGFTFMMRLV